MHYEIIKTLALNMFMWYNGTSIFVKYMDTPFHVGYLIVTYMHIDEDFTSL